MGEVDESVRVALRERAEGSVAVEELLAGARRRGVRRRRLQHTLLGAVTASSVAAAMVLVSALGPITYGGPDAAENRDVVSWLPRPPRADPGDGNALRLDVADPDANLLEWFTEGDKQSLVVGRVRNWLGVRGYVVSRARNQSELNNAYPERHEDDVTDNVSTEQMVIGGGVGTLLLGDRWGFVRWLRSDGMWIGVSIVFENGPDRRPGDERRAILQVAQWVRADAAYRCVVDFRLSWTPPGSRPVGCLLSIAPGLRRYGQALATEHRKTIVVSTEPARNAQPFLANTSSGDRPVELEEHLARYQFGDRVFEISAPDLSPDDALKLVFGFAPLRDPIPEK